MKTIVKYAILIITAVVMLSCKADYNFTGVKGNGEVTTSTRFNGEAFSSIKASEGLNVILTQSESTLVKVQSDSNIQDLILTEIIDGVLVLHTKEQIGRAEAKKVMVHFTNLNGIRTSSGASVDNTNALNMNNIVIKASSGSSIDLKLKAITITCETSSGSDIELSGNTSNFTGSASSGSSIEADNLVANNCNTKASSGASIDVNCTKVIDAKASSGASIEYAGKPAEVSKSKSSGGSISKTE